MGTEAHLHQHKMLSRQLIKRDDRGSKEWLETLVWLPELWPAGTLDPWAVQGRTPVWRTLGECWTVPDWNQAPPPMDHAQSLARLTVAWANRLTQEAMNEVPFWEWPVAALWHGQSPTLEVLTALLPRCSQELLHHFWTSSDLAQEPNALARLGHAALQAGRNDMLTWALKQGLEPNAANASGSPLLHVAQSPEQVALLVRAGASPEARDRQGRTAQEAWAQGALLAKDEYGSRARACTAASRLMRALRAEGCPLSAPDLVFCLITQEQIDTAEIRDAGLSDLLEASPVATWPIPDGDRWSLLGHVARRLTTSPRGAAGDSGDLLATILSGRPTAARQDLWRHASIPGCPDVLLALAALGRVGTADRPVAERLFIRMKQALATLYPDPTSWSTALLPAARALQHWSNRERARTERLIMPWHLLVRPLSSKTRAARSATDALGPPDWWRTLSAPATQACATDVGLWLIETTRRQELGVQDALCAHWDGLETASAEVLQAWAPALLGMCRRLQMGEQEEQEKKRSMNTWPVWDVGGLRPRLARWSERGVDWGCALDALKQYLPADVHQELSGWMRPYVIQGKLSDILSQPQQETRKLRM